MAGKHTLALLGLVISVVSAENTASSRILDGTDVSSGTYPWVVSIRVNYGHVCMGSIIDKDFILTAAHCVASSDPRNLTARVGSVNLYAGGNIVFIDSIIIHPFYGNFLHDVALLKMSQTLKFDDKINKISLAKAHDVVEEGTPISVTGWGLKENGTFPYKLQHASMYVLSESECELEAGYGYDSVLCMAHPENAGICRGDDGAGVLSGSKLVGVASFSFGGCGTNYPDVASKVSYYSSWINKVIYNK